MSTQAPKNSMADAIETMDALSQEGFGQIASIAKLALSHLETPRAYRDHTEIARALEAIAHKAEDVMNCINVTAEDAGYAYVDKAQELRADAQLAARREPIPGVR